MRIKTLRIHPDDNLEVALTNLNKGELVDSYGDVYPLLHDIPAKHKYAIKEFNAEDDITMYGVLVGKATQLIRKGELISLGNIRHASNDFRLKERKTDWIKPDLSSWQDKTFMGFHRKDGSVGIANYWLIIPLVFCENKNVEVLQEAFIKELGYQNETSAQRNQVKQLVQLYQSGKTQEDILATDISANSGNSTRMDLVFPNVDGVKFLTHTLGCGGTKEDTQALCGLLAGYITHPNVAGATVLSLG